MGGDPVGSNVKNDPVANLQLIKMGHGLSFDTKEGVLVKEDENGNVRRIRVSLRNAKGEWEPVKGKTLSKEHIVELVNIMSKTLSIDVIKDKPFSAFELYADGTVRYKMNKDENFTELDRAKGTDDFRKVVGRVYELFGVAIPSSGALNYNNNNNSTSSSSSSVKAKEKNNEKKPKIETNKIIKASADGNCAYHALSLVLKKKGIKLNHQELRMQAHTWLVENWKKDETANAYVTGACTDYNNEVKKNNKDMERTHKMLLLAQSTEEGKRERYKEENEGFERSKKKEITPEQYVNEYIPQEGNWGGLPEFYAIAMINKITIKIKNASPDGKDIILNGNSSGKSVTIIYNRTDEREGDHYDGYDE